MLPKPQITCSRASGGHLTDERVRSVTPVVAPTGVLVDADEVNTIVVAVARRFITGPVLQTSEGQHRGTGMHKT